MQEAWFPSLGQGDPLRRNGNSHQYPCLETSTDRAAWWATAQRVTESQTQLKRFSMHSPKEAQTRVNKKHRESALTPDIFQCIHMIQ